MKFVAKQIRGIRLQLLRQLQLSNHSIKRDAKQCGYHPNKDEQNAIASILSDMDAEISALETKLAKYKQVKQGMMQNLLTGKIRLV